MAEFVDVMKMVQKHCRDTICLGCPLSLYNNGHQTTCATFLIDHPEEALEVVLKCQQEQSRPTWDQYFEEHYNEAIPEGIWALLNGEKK